uniref:GRAM domain containing 1Ba n=1 Tax=Gadus morhua TaxID=8049 RepID=A0A8C4Z616_GADMO
QNPNFLPRESLNSFLFCICSLSGCHGFLSPTHSTASNSNRSTPACSPVLRKRSRSSTPQLSPDNESYTMVEKGSLDPAPDRSPSTPEPAAQNHHQQQPQQHQSWYNVLSPTYKQRNEDFRKLFKSLPDTERLIVDYSCALQRDILLQGRLYLSENWICFYSNIFRWETLLMVRLKDICTMTKEKTARLIPNAIQLCTDNEKHFFTSFGARDRTYMMMFRLWQNALLEKPLCPKELWHFVHQCYGSELGLTSDDEDYIASLTKPSTGPQDELPLGLVEEDPPTPLREGEVPPPPLLAEEQADQQDVGHSPAPSLDLDEHEELPTELSDSSETHDEGEVQAFQEDLRGRQYINEVYKFSVDKMFSVLFTESPFMRGFLEQRRFSDVVNRPWTTELEADQTRELTYNVSLSNPLTPKTAAVSETQTLYKASQERECYIVDAEVVTHHVPYHDYFYTLNRYVLTRVAKHKCRLRVSTEIRYRKQPWGLVLLVFLNMMLFYKLWGLEYTAQSLTSWRDLQPQESKPPQTNLEWTQLLESQQRYHDDELQKWKEILESSVLLLYEVSRRV